MTYYHLPWLTMTSTELLRHFLTTSWLRLRPWSTGRTSPRQHSRWLGHSEPPLLRSQSPHRDRGEGWDMVGCGTTASGYDQSQRMEIVTQLMQVWGICCKRTQLVAMWILLHHNMKHWTASARVSTGPRDHICSISANFEDLKILMEIPTNHPTDQTWRFAEQFFGTFCFDFHN